MSVYQTPDQDDVHLVPYNIFLSGLGRSWFAQPLKDNWVELADLIKKVNIK